MSKNQAAPRRFAVIDGGRKPKAGPIFERRELIRCTKCDNTEKFQGYVIHSPMNILINRLPGEKDVYDVSEVFYTSGPDTIEVATHCAICGSDKLEFTPVDDNNTPI